MVARHASDSEKSIILPYTVLFHMQLSSDLEVVHDIGNLFIRLFMLDNRMLHAILSRTFLNALRFILMVCNNAVFKVSFAFGLTLVPANV